MPRSFKNYLTGKLGESLVVAELARRDIVATAFAGNVPDIDILAYRDGASAALQVKTWRGGGVQFDADRFLTIEQTGARQFVREELVLAGDLIYVFVLVTYQTSADRFFILDQTEVERVIAKNYQDHLDRNGGVRPRNAHSTHVAVYEPDLRPFENKWDLVREKLSAAAR
ncbi:MAG: hypothetical protein EXR43_02385 [Dehalococcoidia bacterium]|nr:hypothetical protein [Dehalococcoidia bacterium]